MKAVLALAASVALLSACQTSEERAEIRRAALVDVAPVGSPVDCIETNRIRQTHVRSDSVIDFEMIDGKVFRNTLDTSCPQLGLEQRIAYRSMIGRLCSIDTITVLSRGGPPGPTCGLSTFQQIRSTAE